MEEVVIRVPYEEFISDPDDLFNRVINGNATIVVERGDGDAVLLKPLHEGNANGGAEAQADLEAFLSTAGGWKGLVDTEQLVEDIYLSRSMPPRPPVKL